MAPSSHQLWMPKQWHWVEYPDGWFETINWIDNTPWPGQRNGFPEFQSQIIYARYLVREVHWTEVLAEDGNGSDIEYTPLGGIRFISGMADSIPGLLARDVLAARSKGLSWTAIGTALGVGRTAAQKRFGHTTHASVEKDSSFSPPSDGVEGIRQRVLFESAVSVLLRDVVVQARCEGFRWAEIADALGVGLTAAQKRFGTGLTLDRVAQLDTELLWLRGAAPDSVSRGRYVKRLESRRRTRLNLTL
jgi:hypothetical protein